MLERLELLKDDPTTLVRRSVANNLNDLGKLRPELLIRTCAAWLESASAECRVLIEHALRSAVKRGNAEALRLLGYGGKPSVAVEDVRFEPRRVAIGGSVSLTFALRSKSKTAQHLLVDAAVRFVKANGNGVPKVFKLKRIVLPPRGKMELQTRISLAVHTTRQPRPGRHAVEILVNGVALPAGSFQVTGPRRSSRKRIKESHALRRVLADRIRRVLGPRPDISEKKMFGGLAFLQDGKMFCGIVKDELMVRVGSDRYEESLAKAHVRPMVFTGRPVNGYVFVSASGCRTDKAVKAWIELGDTFVATLDKAIRSTARKSVSSRPRPNAAWHEGHPMPKSPTAEQRLAWHAAHEKSCGCRPMPAKLRAMMK